MVTRPIRYLTLLEALDAIPTTQRVDSAAMRAIVDAPMQVGPPRGDGDLHDCAAALLDEVLRQWPLRRGNARLAFVLVVRFYEVNDAAVDSDLLQGLVIARLDGDASVGGVSELLRARRR